jgi:hypothetical protein
MDLLYAKLTQKVSYSQVLFTIITPSSIPFSKKIECTSSLNRDQHDENKDNIEVYIGVHTQIASVVTN